MFGTSELVIVLLIIVVVFGSTKLPQLGDGLGRAIKNFKRAVTNPNEVDVTPKKPELPADPAPTAADKTAKG
jgi:sec-independent protein translocase protein TatA